MPVFGRVYTLGSKGAAAPGAPVLGGAGYVRRRRFWMAAAVLACLAVLL